MVQSLNGQVLLGRREWLLLNDNNEPQPVGSDNKPLVDKPLQINLREPSEVDADFQNDSGIVGNMGDEDIEQAQYNVMSLITDKFIGLNKRIDKLNKELEIEIGKNKEDISDIKKTSCSAFIKQNCNTKTIQGCMECADYYDEIKQLPEECYIGNTLEMQCSYRLNDNEEEEQRIDLEGGTDSNFVPCESLDHYDCKTIIQNNYNYYQKDQDKICLWDTQDNNPDITKTDLKCRRLCDQYQTEDNCNNKKGCSYISGKCVENICENIINPDDCGIDNENRELDNLCGTGNNSRGEEEDFITWKQWRGIYPTELSFPICYYKDLTQDGTRIKSLDTTGSYSNTRDYCESTDGPTPELQGKGIYYETIDEFNSSNKGIPRNPYPNSGDIRYDSDDTDPLPICRTYNNIMEDSHIFLDNSREDGMIHCSHNSQSGEETSYNFSNSDPDPCVDSQGQDNFIFLDQENTETTDSSRNTGNTGDTGTTSQRENPFTTYQNNVCNSRKNTKNDCENQDSRCYLNNRKECVRKSNQQDLNCENYSGDSNYCIDTNSCIKMENLENLENKCYYQNCTDIPGKTNEDCQNNITKYNNFSQGDAEFHMCQINESRTGCELDDRSNSLVEKISQDNYNENRSILIGTIIAYIIVIFILLVYFCKKFSADAVDKGIIVVFVLLTLVLYIIGYILTNYLGFDIDITKIISNKDNLCNSDMRNKTIGKYIEIDNKCSDKKDGLIIYNIVVLLVITGLICLIGINIEDAFDLGGAFIGNIPDRADIAPENKTALMIFAVIFIISFIAKLILDGSGDNNDNEYIPNGIKTDLKLSEDEDIKLKHILICDAPDSLSPENIDPSKYDLYYKYVNYNENNIYFKDYELNLLGVIIRIIIFFGIIIAGGVLSMDDDYEEKIPFFILIASIICILFYVFSNSNISWLKLRRLGINDVSISCGDKNLNDLYKQDFIGEQELNNRTTDDSRGECLTRGGFCRRSSYDQQISDNVPEMDPSTQTINLIDQNNYNTFCITYKNWKNIVNNSDEIDDDYKQYMLKQPLYNAFYDKITKFSNINNKQDVIDYKNEWFNDIDDTANNFSVFVFIFGLCFLITHLLYFSKLSMILYIKKQARNQSLGDPNRVVFTIVLMVLILIGVISFLCFNYNYLLDDFIEEYSNQNIDIITSKYRVFDGKDHQKGDCLKCIGKSSSGNPVILGLDNTSTVSDSIQCQIQSGCLNTELIDYFSGDNPRSDNHQCAGKNFVEADKDYVKNHFYNKNDCEIKDKDNKKINIETIYARSNGLPGSYKDLEIDEVRISDIDELKNSDLNLYKGGAGWNFQNINIICLTAGIIISLCLCYAVLASREDVSVDQRIYKHNLPGTQYNIVNFYFLFCSVTIIFLLLRWGFHSSYETNYNNFIDTLNEFIKTPDNYKKENEECEFAHIDTDKFRKWNGGLFYYYIAFTIVFSIIALILGDRIGELSWETVYRRIAPQ